MFDEKNVALMKEAISVIKSAGKTFGVSTGSDDINTARKFYDMGINMISSGQDYRYLFDIAVRNRERIKRMFNGE